MIDMIRSMRFKLPLIFVLAADTDRIVFTPQVDEYNMPAWNASNWIVKPCPAHPGLRAGQARRSAAVLVRGAAESARERQGTVGQTQHGP